MGDRRKIKYLLDLFPVVNILNEVPVMLVSVFLKENENKKLVLVVDFLRIFTGILGYVR